jgi:hypothetical protein
MANLETIDLGRHGVYEVLISDDFTNAAWHEAKAKAKTAPKGFRLPLDYELEALFESALLKGLVKSGFYWSGTETAVTRARSQQYGGSPSEHWIMNPRHVEDKNGLNIFLLVRKIGSKKTKMPFSKKVLELSLNPSVRKRFHFNNYVKNNLNRDGVLQIYKQGFLGVHSFIEMLKWGGLRIPNLNLVSKSEILEIERKLLKLDELISNNDPATIIDQYLSNSEIKIRGVGISFITKHLYFKRPNYFIIYDKFMINVHVAMLLEDDSNLIYEYYGRSNDRADYHIRYKSEGAAYADFLTRLNILYKKVNMELELRSAPKFRTIGQFEAFLFGNHRDKDDLNPRVMTSKYIAEHQGRRP